MIQVFPHNAVRFYGIRMVKCNLNFCRQDYVFKVTLDSTTKLVSSNRRVYAFQSSYVLMFTAILDRMLIRMLYFSAFNNDVGISTCIASDGG